VLWRASDQLDIDKDDECLGGEGTDRKTFGAMLWEFGRYDTSGKFEVVTYEVERGVIRVLLHLCHGSACFEIRQFGPSRTTKVGFDRIIYPRASRHHISNIGISGQIS
jgi:hypothetical protein